MSNPDGTGEPNDLDKINLEVNESRKELRRKTKEWNKQNPPNILLTCSDGSVIGLWKSGQTVFVRYAFVPDLFAPQSGIELEPEVVDAIVQLSKEKT